MLAVVFAILVLLKVVLVFLNPKGWFKFGKSLMKQRGLLWVIYIIIGVLSGYYVFVNVDPASVGAVFLLATALIGMRLMPLSDKLVKSLEGEFVGASRKKLLKKHWFSLIVWVVLSIWILVAVL